MIHQLLDRPRSLTRRIRRLLLATATLSAAGCAASVTAYQPDRLRAEIHHRAPDLPESAGVVPFDVDPASVESARRVVEQYSHPEDRVRALVEMMFSGAGFALTYAPIVTGTAREVLATRQGNCLALASVFVGLARALGLEAYYLDASERVSETSQIQPGIFVNTGHITAYVALEQTKWYLDFDHTLAGIPRHFRVIDDLEATAHFYNNRGYERLEQALLDGAPADWASAAQDFELATRIQPDFGRAWNNLAVARVRLGQSIAAEVAYREAIRVAPRSAAAYDNLGGLYLATGRPRDALEVVRQAARLDPHGGYTLFTLGRALLANGDAEGGRAALKEAAAVRVGSAERMLSKLELYERRGGARADSSAEVARPRARGNAR